MPSAADLEAAARKLVDKGRIPEAGDKYEEAAAAREAEGNPHDAALDHETAAGIHEGLAAQAKAAGNMGAAQAEEADAKAEHTKAGDDFSADAKKSDTAGDTGVAAGAWDAAARAYARAKEWAKCGACHEEAAKRFAQLAGPHAQVGNSLVSTAKAKERAAHNYEKMSDPGSKPGAAELDRLAALWYDLAAKDEDQAADELGRAANLHWRAARSWGLAWAAYKDANDNTGADRAEAGNHAEDAAGNDDRKASQSAATRARSDETKSENESQEAEKDK